MGGRGIFVREMHLLGKSEEKHESFVKTALLLEGTEKFKLA